MTRGTMPSTSPATDRLPQRRLTEKGLATRNRILDATVACIVRSGFAATTIETVMAEAGLSRGSVLHQFPTRLDLTIATAERSMRRVMEAARERAAAIPDPFERMANYAQIVWETHSLPDGLAVTDILQAARWDAELLRGIQPVAAQVEEEVERELIALGSMGGLVDPAAMVTRGWMLVATARGLIMEYEINHDRRMIKAAIEEMRSSHRRYCEAHVRRSDNGHA